MSSEKSTFAEELSTIGEQTRTPITVRLSNEVVTLLSSQLYQSPLKAIEELVVNSYDADAEECRVAVPEAGSQPRAVLVYDDGVGMDAEGLADLWMIARSNKWTNERHTGMERKQIGKFGIGKLATYAIANTVTYMSRTANEILAVRADFEKFREDKQGTLPVEFPVTRIGKWEGLKDSEILKAACEMAGVDLEGLLAEDQTSWTIVLLEQLKPTPLHLGRLKWVLRTAMPLRSDFQVFLNEEQIVSSKEDGGTVVEFDVTELPTKRLESAKRETEEDWEVTDGKLVSGSFPEGVQGSVVVTENSLHSGKSSDLGRSHGFFVRVRGRLINEEDPLFALSPLSYQTFNRFRADLTVDDLDEAVTAPREGIGESRLKTRLLPLLSEIFYEARDRYDDWLKAQDEEVKRKREAERTYVPVRLMEQPIADVLSVPSNEAEKGAEADDSWFYLEIATEQESLKTLAAELYRKPRNDKYRYRYTNEGRTGRLVRFDPAESVLYLNADHDLVSAYYEDPRARVLLEDLATAEAVLEVYLREYGMAAHIVGEVLERRDSLLRGLANEHIFSVARVSQALKDSANDEHDLEVALVAASRALGFVSTHIGGAGEPDGVGRFRNYPDGEKKITLEAKSSHAIPTLAQLDFAGLAEHVKKSNADGCLLLAPAYPGRGEESAVSARAQECRVSCWTIDKLGSVVVAVETRRIGAREVLDIVLNRFSPAAVAVAVDELLEEPKWENRALYVEVLNALQRLDGRLVDRARTVAHIAAEVTREPNFAAVPEGEIRNALAELSGASQGALMLKDERLVVNASFDEIRRRLSGLTGDGGNPRRGGSFRDFSSE